MGRTEALARLYRCGVVAIMRKTESALAIEAAEALVAGGIDLIEVTMNTPGALEMIRDLVRHFPQERALIGAGTVLDVAAAQAAIEAGAEFIVCPHLDEKIVAYAGHHDVMVVPGTLTPTEIVRAMAAGADAIKVFPAGPLGPSYIRDLLGPLDGARLVPTGGITPDNAEVYIQAGAFALGAGSALVDAGTVAARDFDTLTMRARRFVEAVQRGRAARRG
jgi:2-dehydro-3-deoxyphosphogluconate aldolase/(4S)-4-hydroxy-2-oxoglutarate aldolase